MNKSSDIDDTICLLRQFTSPGTSYIIIDGLDEYQKAHRRELLAALSSLVSSSKSLHLFLCGRTGLHDEINAQFKETIHLPLEYDVISKDIEIYVEGIVDQKVQDEDLKVGDPSLIGEIKSALAKGAQGMFLWAYFQVEEISSQPCDEDIRLALHNLPKDLNEIFNRALRRILAGSHSKETQKLFTWVNAARRPLNLRELREAIAIKVGQQYSDKARQCNDMVKVASWCENLVETEEESETVQFVHHSVRTFLLGRPTDPALAGFHMALEEADHELGEICLTYLDFNDFKRAMMIRPKPINISPLDIINATSIHGSKLASLRKLALEPGSSVKSFDLRRSIDPDKAATMTLATKSIMDEYPFLEYATVHWISHTKYFGEKKSKTWAVLCQVLSGNYEFVKLPWKSDARFQNDALGWANSNRHGTIVRILWSDEVELSFKWAVANDDLALFDILFDEMKYEVPGRIFVYAASVGHIRAIEELVLSGKVHVNGKAEGTTALIAAASKQRLDVIDKLVSLGADVDISNGRYSSDGEVRLETPLIAAARRGHLDVVDRLMTYGADLDVGTRDYTALIAAASRHHVAIIERLVGAGANLDADAGHHTALSKAAAKGYLGIVDMLLAAGADVNASSNRNTALTRAVEHGQLDVVDRLLAAGVDDATTTYSALARSAKQGNTMLYCKLLNHEVLLSHKARSRTMLHVAASEIDTDRVGTLLEAGVKADAVNMTGSTALHIASERGSVEVAMKLREFMGVEALGIRNRRGDTALHIAVRHGHTEIAKLLADSGEALVRVENNAGQTALDLARSCWSERIVDILENPQTISRIVEGVDSLAHSTIMKEE
ncbi:hypothetical protein PG984_016187 [Apiospora sp. TS-2023a]